MPSSLEKLTAHLENLKKTVEGSIRTDPLVPTDEIEFICGFIQTNEDAQGILGLCNNRTNLKHLITHVIPIIHKLLKNPRDPPENSRFLVFYFMLFVECINKVYSIDSMNSIDRGCIEMIILLADFVLKQGIPEFICNSYIKLVEAAGNVSNFVFQVFNDKLLVLLKKKAPKKEVRACLLLFTKFVSTTNSLSMALDVLANDYIAFKKYRKEYCNTITQMVIKTFRQSSEDFQNQEVYIPAAERVIEIFLRKRIVKSYRWEAYTALCLVDQPMLNSPQTAMIFGSVIKALSARPTAHDQDFEYALNCALYSAMAVVESKATENYKLFFEKFKVTLCDIAENLMEVVANHYTTARYYMSVYLPIALFITDQGEFEKILLLFTSEKSNLPRAFNCKVIERCSKYIVSDQKWAAIIKAIIQTIEASASDADVQYNLHHIFNTFEQYPKILETILKTNPGLASLLWKPCSRAGMKALTKSFLMALDSKERTIKDWQIIECTASAILSSAHLYMSLKESRIMLLKPILDFIMKTAKEMLSMPNNLIDLPQVVVFVIQMEGICLCLLPTPLASTGLSILSDVIQIAEEKHVVEISQLPVSNYKRFLKICKEYGKFDSTNPNVFRPLCEIKEERISATKALSRHIATISHALDPIAVNESISDVQNEMSYNLLCSEFTDSILLFGALTRKIMPSFLTVFEAVLQSSETSGYSSALLLPITLQPNNYPSIGECILLRARKISAQLTTLDSHFTANSMKLLQILISSPGWETSCFDSKYVEEIALTFTSYINMLASPQRLFQCSEFLLAALTKYRSLMSMEGKKQIGRTLSTWLARIECGPSTEKAGASLCNALALVLDGITFSVDSYEELNFITSSLDTRLEKQPTLHKEVASAIAAIYKSNLNLFSRYELARTLIGAPLSRAAYILAAEKALINNNTETTERSEFGIIDALFDNDYAIIREIFRTIPVNKSEVVGYNIALAAISRHVEIEVVELMTDIEIMNSTESSKNMIFRGNAVMSRTVVAFTKICGSQWAKELYTEVSNYIKNVVAGGESLNIKSARLGPNEDINKNRETYRKCFIKAINVITTSIPRLPIIVIHMLQVVYAKVAEKFGSEHGTMILNGILFLRFIIPTLTSSIPDSSDKYSEKLRQSLITLSVGLMAAALRGNLTEKGPDFECFNDVAELALDRFSASVNHIISTDLKQAASRWLEVDEHVVSEALAHNFALIYTDLITSIYEASTEESRGLTRAESAFLSEVSQAVERPRTYEYQDVNEVFLNSNIILKEMLSLQPIDDEEQMLFESIFFKDTPESSEFNIFYFIYDKHYDVRIKPLISYIINRVAELKGPYYIVADLSGITQDEINELAPHRRLIPLLPPDVKERLMKIFVTRSSIDFVTHLTNNKQSIPYAEKFKFANDIEDIHPIEALSTKIPEENQEVLKHEGTSLITVINDKEALIKLGRTSIFISFEIDGLHANDSLFYRKIMKVSKLKALQNKDMQFTITTKAGKALTFTITLASSLYHLIISSFERVNAKLVKYPSIFTDSSDSVSTKWLLFIIGLVGVQETSCKYLSDTAFSLVQSTIRAYNFPIQMPSSPQYAAEHARTLMSSAAKAFPQEAGPFIVEFEKVVSVIENPLPAFQLLPPWGKIIASGAGGYPAQRFIIELQIPNHDCARVVSHTLWNDISNRKYIKQMLKVYFPIATESNKHLLDVFTCKDPKAVSEVAVSEILERRQTAIYIALDLVKIGKFDLETYGVPLLHATLCACGSTAANEELAELAEKTVKKILPVNRRSPSIIEPMINKDYEKLAEVVNTVVGRSLLVRKELISLFKNDAGTEFEEKAKIFNKFLEK